jgi:hypothetical protein
LSVFSKEKNTKASSSGVNQAVTALKQPGLIHSSIRCTPAMGAGITKHVWTLKDLLLNATGV